MTVFQYFFILLMSLQLDNVFKIPEEYAWFPYSEYNKLKQIFHYQINMSPIVEKFINVTTSYVVNSTLDALFLVPIEI